MIVPVIELFKFLVIFRFHELCHVQKSKIGIYDPK